MSSKDLKEIGNLKKNIDEEDYQSKKRQKRSDLEKIQTDNDITTVENEISIDSKKKVCNEEIESKVENNCVVCFEIGNVENPLLEHSCQQCNKESWMICSSCNSLLLSRTCPVCRSDYAPLVLYAVPIFEIFEATDKSFEQTEENKTILLKTVIKQLIGISNIAVWSPETLIMTFSLPIDGINFLTCTIALTESPIINCQFLFTNKIWDELENQAESENTLNNCETVNKSKASKKIFEATKSNGSILLTPFSSENLQQL